MVVRISRESAGFVLPCFADCLVECEAFEGLERAAEVVGGDEGAEVLPELIADSVMVAFDGRFLDGAVHPLDLSVGPGMARLGEAVIDVVRAQASSKECAQKRSPLAMARLVSDAPSRQRQAW